MVLLGSNLGFKIFNTRSQFNIALALGINSLLEVHVLVAVFVFQGLQVIQFVLETDNLIFQLNDFTLALNELCLLALKIKGLGVNEFIEIVDPGQLLRDVVFEGAGLRRQVIGLLGLHLILIVQLINFFSILTVSLSQIHQLSFQVLLLGLQLRVQILVLSQITSESGDLGVPRVQDVLLSVELCIEVSVLLLSVDEQTLLIIDLLSQGRDHIDVYLNSTLVVIFHSSLFIGNSVEVLLQGEELILKQLVFSLSLSELHGLGSQLSDESIFVVLSDGGIGELSLWTS